MKQKLQTGEIVEKTLNCEKCGQEHKIKIDVSKLTEGQICGQEPILDNFVCPNLAVMYRVKSFAIDTRVNIFKEKSLVSEHQNIEKSLKLEWGEENFSAKVTRFKKLDLAILGVPDEYYNLMKPIISSYCCGYYYPAMTGAGALGERILNRLLINTRDYFKSSKHYKKIWNKQSFDQWDFPIKILLEWKIISSDVADLFTKLKKYRNDATHYNDNYDFEINSHEAIKILANIIDLQFNYTNREDLLWVFNVPGEILVRSEFIGDPFVKEFILPHCNLEIPIQHKEVLLKPFSDEEFIEIRNTIKS